MRCWPRIVITPHQRSGVLLPAVKLLNVASLFVAAAIVALAHVSPLSAQEQRPDFDIEQVTIPDSPPAARLGIGSYQQNCAPCHGLLGMGDGPAAADLPGPPTAFADPDALWERSPAELFHTTKFGWLERLMPPWQNQLTDAEIWHTTAYAWSLHTAQQEHTLGADLYAASCASCHGESGAGDGPEAAERLVDFSDVVYAMTKSQANWMAGWQAAHPEMGEEWSLAEQRAVLEYVRAFSYAPVWESGLRPGNGVVRGTVVQGTAGGPEVERATVTLEAFADFQPMAALTTTVGADGRFEFGGLTVDPNVVYLASASAAGVRYSSPIVTLTAEQPEAETVVTIYETTGDASGVALDRVHWILDSQPGALIVLQVLEFGNNGDRTFIGEQAAGIDEPVTVAFHVPAEAVELSFENGALGSRFRQAGDLIYDTTPLVPGPATKQIVMQYALPHQGDSITLEQEFLYPVALLNMLAADLPGLTIEAPNLTNTGVQDFQGVSYQLWRGEQLAAGPVALSLSGLLRSGDLDPRATIGATAGSASGSGAVRAVEPFAPWMAWAMGLGVSLALAGVVAWSWREGRLESGDAPESLRRQRDDLVRRAARLDDLHALGEVGPDEWRVRRAQIKTKLMEIDSRLAARGQKNHV